MWSCGQRCRQPRCQGRSREQCGKVDASVPVVRLRDMDSVFAEIDWPAKATGSATGRLCRLGAVYWQPSALTVCSPIWRRSDAARSAFASHSGAARADVLTQIMKQGLQVTAVGLAIGVAGALAVNRLIGSCCSACSRRIPQRWRP